MHLEHYDAMFSVYNDVFMVIMYYVVAYTVVIFIRTASEIINMASIYIYIYLEIIYIHKLRNLYAQVNILK